MTRDPIVQRTCPGWRICLAALVLGLSACATTGESPSASGEVLTAEEAIASGDEAARRGNFERALAYYLRAVGVEETADGWFRVGAACTRLGKSERALAAYLKVLELDPLHAGAHEGAGLEYMALGEAESARERLAKAVELDRRRWRAHNGLGILADRAEDYAAAVGHYETAIEINPESPMLLNNLGYSRYLSGDLDQAARFFYQATQLDPDYGAAWANLGRVYARRGWYFDAVSILARTMDEARAHNDVGYIALRNGDLAASEELLNEAVRLSPTYYPAAQQNLERVRARLRGKGMGAAEPPLVGSSGPPGPVRGDEG